MERTLAARIGATVLTVRIRQRLSRTALAQQAGVSLSTIHALEKGTRPAIDTDTIEKVARGLGMTPDALLCETLDVSQRTGDVLCIIPIPAPPGTDPIPDVSRYVLDQVRVFLRRMTLLPPKTKETK